MDFHSLLRKAKHGIEDLLPGDDRHSHTHHGHECHESHGHTNRYSSFAPQSSGRVKWHVDGASYFWAVSMAIEEARDYIYILDWWLSPEVYLRRPPARNERYRLDHLLKAAAERGVKIYVVVYKEVPQVLTLNSKHTKRTLEGLHPNIKVFRYPDHYNTLVTGFKDLHSNFQNFSLKTFSLARASEDVVKALYGTAEDVVLYFAHHEKLCLVDGKVAFMGGLDLCFGRYDTHSHPIADVHPGNLDEVIFPGQDYNNARVYDFEDVNKWENNKLDRTKSSRMGWADVSISLSGPIVDSLAAHFVERWNFLFDKKYTNREAGRYLPLELPQSQQQEPRSLLDGQQYLGGLQQRFSRHVSRFLGDEQQEAPRSQQGDGADIQLTRSCGRWSLGVNTEHSIANAYIDAIKNAKHFVYMENQFFITATSDKQRPVKNKIGRVIVDRIVRAHRNRERFQIVVVMPAVPAFAGDLRSDSAISTRAIMEFQYFSINRGGHSILETLRQEGVDDPHQYINFYNLRNYDRINTGAAMADAERESGVRYEDARREFDRLHGASDECDPSPPGDSQYRRYQAAACRLKDQTWDSISACYMLNGPDLRSVPWTGSPEAELDAFVSEQLYVHSKLLIADDKVVICGSANLNDRSQAGDHDSEIAVVIEDPTPVASSMGGRPYTASAFAASLRRHLYRKHLGLLPPQRPDAPDRNWTPVTHDAQNDYDWDSPADKLVRDPMSREFLDLWRSTARRNADIFSRAFHPVPDNSVRTWDDYDRFFSRRFVIPGEPAEKAAEGYRQGKVDYGHVVRDEFPGGVQELKDWLSGVRGSLVEMPLQFLIDVEDLAEDGLALNSLTDELYT